MKMTYARRAQRRCKMENMTTQPAKGTAEDAAYVQFIEAKEDDKARRTLMRLLEGHATSVCFLVLRRSDPEVIESAVDNVMLALASFKGESRFSTWVHRVMLNEMYMQRRREAQRKEEALLPRLIENLPGASSVEYIDLMLTIKQACTPEEFALFQHVIVAGESTYEAAESLGLPQKTVWSRKTQLMRKLQNALGERISRGN